MNKFFSLLVRILYFCIDKRINFFVKIKFVIVYIIDIIKIIILNSPTKKVLFMTGQDFFFIGSHINLLFDNIIVHLSNYSKYYMNADIVIDVGASFGTFPLMARFLNSKTNVYSFEPSKESFELLCKNVKNLKKVHLFNKAVGNINKKVLFNYNPSFPEGSLIKIGKEHSNNQYLVNQITLDDFIKVNKIKKISLLKIDTEGYERYVLEGAKKTLQITDYLIIETETSSINNQIAILTILKKLGFTFINIEVINRNIDNTIGSLDLVFKKINNQ